MTEIYLHIVARMADYMATHPYRWRLETAMVGACGDGSQVPQSSTGRPQCREDTRVGKQRNSTARVDSIGWCVSFLIMYSSSVPGKVRDSRSCQACMVFSCAVICWARAPDPDARVARSSACRARGSVSVSISMRAHALSLATSHAAISVDTY